MVHDQHELILVEQRGDDLGVLDRSHEAEVALLAQHHLEHILRVPAAHRQVHARMVGLEPMQHGRQHVRAHRRRRTDRQSPAASAGNLDHRLVPPPHGGERPLGVRQEGAPGLGQAAAVTATSKENTAERALQSLDARRKRWLADEQGVRRAADRPVASHLDEGLELSELRSDYIGHADAIH
jgi:hypothetical protein